MPDHYRRKTVEVEAMQLVKGTDNYKDLCDWIHGSSRGATMVHHGDGNVYFRSIYGDETIHPGEWLIRGSNGEFRTSSAAMFAQTYEKTSDDLQSAALLVLDATYGDAHFDGYEISARACAALRVLANAMDYEEDR